MKKNKPWIWLGVTTMVVALDQFLKAWVTLHFTLFARREIVGQTFITLTRILNRGIMWGHYSSVPRGYIELYTRYLPSVALAMFLCFLIVRWGQARTVERWGLCSLFAGGVSNLWDHWVSYSVTDTLALYIGNNQILPFNLADVALCMGASLLFFVLSCELVGTFSPKKSEAH